MALVDLSTIYSWLGLSDPTSDETTLLTTLRGYAQTLVKEYLGYQVEGPATYTEYLPHVGPLREVIDTGLGLMWMNYDWSRLFLTELPVRSITTIHANENAYGIDANWTSDYLKEAGVDYFLDVTRSGISRTGIVYSIGGNWTTTPRSVKVVYTAGWTSDELATTTIPKATLLATVAAWQTALSNQGGPEREGFGPMTREQIGLQLEAGYDTESVKNIAGMFQELPGECKQLLARYRRYDVI